MKSKRGRAAKDVERKGLVLPEGWQRVRLNNRTAYKTPDETIYWTRIQMERVLKEKMRTA